MKNQLVNSARCFVPALALLATAPAVVTSLPAQEVEGAVADAKTTAIKAMLKDLDDQIDRIDEFLGNAPTPQDKAAAKSRLEQLKERRAELRKNYVQARYDALKADVQVEYNKLALWAKKTFANDPDAKLDRQIDAALDAKIAMASLDDELKRLDDICDGLPKGTNRDAAKLRLKTFNARRAELAANYDQKAYDKLVGDLRAEVKRLTH